jgi:hypothetical protein
VEGPWKVIALQEGCASQAEEQAAAEAMTPASEHTASEEPGLLMQPPDPESRMVVSGSREPMEAEAEAVQQQSSVKQSSRRVLRGAMAGW